MRKVLIAIGILFLFSSGNAQGRTVLSGIVISAKSGKAIVGATIQLEKRGTTSDSLGQFKLYGLSAGLNRIRFLAPGYPDLDTVIKVSDDCNFEFRWSLVVPCSGKFTAEQARTDIRKGKAFIMITPSAEMKLSASIFKKNYGVSFMTWGGCELPGNYDCFAEYNEVVFRYLDDHYGSSWRQFLPDEVFGRPL